MHYFTDIDAARAMHADLGGWLLDLGETPTHAIPAGALPPNGAVLRQGAGPMRAVWERVYLVTNDKGAVYDLRGELFLAECERRQVWDETADD